MNDTTETAPTETPNSAGPMDDTSESRGEKGDRTPLTTQPKAHGRYIRKPREEGEGGQRAERGHVWDAHESGKGEEKEELRPTAIGQVQHPKPSQPIMMGAPQASSATEAAESHPNSNW